MKRREFITLLGGAAVAWPLAARAQQPRQIGMLLTVQESDPATQGSIAVFQRQLRELGWVEDRTVRFERRYAGGYPQRKTRPWSLRCAGKPTAFQLSLCRCPIRSATASLLGAPRRKRDGFH